MYLNPRDHDSRSNGRGLGLRPLRIAKDCTSGRDTGLQASWVTPWTAKKDLATSLVGPGSHARGKLNCTWALWIQREVEYTRNCNPMPSMWIRIPRGAPPIQKTQFWFPSFGRRWKLDVWKGGGRESSMREARGQGAMHCCDGGEKRGEEQGEEQGGRRAGARCAC